MGTSGAFGGSGAWSDTVDSLYDSADALGSDNEAPIATTVMATLGRSLARGDRRGKSYDVSDLLGGRGIAGASSSGDGRDSGGAPFTREAARGSLVLDALASIENGEIPHLVEYGVDFTSLEGLSGLKLLTELIGLILGPPSHPDDAALQQALIATMRSSEKQAAGTLAETIGRFVSELAWRRTVVQLTTSQRRVSAIGSSMRRLEERVRTYISGKVQQVTGQLVNATPQTVADYASKLAAKACRLFGRGDDK
ncbi:hypothetical protein [Leifsonia aquatica]|uniref:Uncharacterized protein n=1 Tax=Leifsonia aquatica TaxID=144185 RepID=A0A7W4YM52_LEIAQ|nr:hypothetical protein [Leifsonia aquatica]MBB2969309.1 hypothetical protein [Leifsonia aquatica]MBN9630096.1 hypothetical protein [Actinomycetota bacterium]